jgi:hypothetical protein
MNAPTVHLIRKHYLHVEMNGAELEGMSLQRTLPDLCRFYLMPALEQVLDRYAPAEGHVLIERLEIDAGNLSLERLEQDLPMAVADAVAELLSKQCQSSNRTVAGAHAESVQHKTEQQSRQEAFLYFLKTGSLPWSFTLPAGKTLEQVILDFRQNEKSPDIFFRPISASLFHLLDSETVRKRLVRQFSSGFLEGLLSTFSPASGDSIHHVIKILRGSDDALEIKCFERWLWDAAFAAVAQGISLTEIKLVSYAWQSASVSTEQFPALAGVLEKHWPGATKAIPKPGLKNTRQINRDRINTRKTHSPQQTDHHNDFPEDLIKNSSLETLSAFGSSIDTKGGSEHNLRAEIDINEGLYINCAGLVLLHPFLPQFFEALGIASGDRILDTDRALCLLYFLATGQSVAPEYELILPKILCNLPLEQPVEAIIELTQAEIEECTALLEAVVRHWEVLRNTGIDSLRGTFLVRPGKVSLHDNGDWLLQVETQGFDILLDQLPWGIGMIRLPWMQRMMRVEWIH